jgi:hypothetical protein
MSKDVIFLEVPVKLDDGFVNDVICTMFEGGSNYWINTIKINHPNGMKLKSTPTSEWAADALNKGGSVTIFPHEYDGDIVTLNKQNLIDGVKKWAAGSNLLEIINEDGQNYIDAGNIDADEADVILQYSVFGEIVFG